MGMRRKRTPSKYILGVGTVWSHKDGAAVSWRQHVEQLTLACEMCVVQQHIKLVVEFP